MRAINYYAHNEEDVYDYIIAEKNNKNGARKSTTMRKTPSKTLQEPPTVDLVPGTNDTNDIKSKDHYEIVIKQLQEKLQQEQKAKLAVQIFESQFKGNMQNKIQAANVFSKLAKGGFKKEFLVKRANR